jgi:hypothetical protein
MGTPFNQNDSRAVVAEGGSYKEGCVEDQRKVATSDATVTVIWRSRPIAVGEAIAVRGFVIGKIDAATSAAYIHVSAAFRRQSAGNVTAVGSPQGTIAEDSAGTPAIVFAANTTDQTVELRVTGIAAESWKWEAKVESIII